MHPRAQINRDTPLPPNPYTTLSQPKWHSAYEAALKLERVDEIHGRVLGYLMLEALDDDARDYVATDINKFKSEPNGATLFDLAQTYVDEFLGLFTHQDGGPPYSRTCSLYELDWSDSPSGHVQPWDILRPRDWKFDLTNIESMPQTLTEAKNAALCRDGKRCVVSREYDFHLWRAGLLTEAEAEIFEKVHMPNSPIRSCGSTYPTHIFPPWTRSDECEERGVRRYSFQAIDIVRGYGHVDVMTELKPSCGQRLSNIITTETDTRSFLNHQHIWFDPVPESPLENTYCIDSWSRQIFCQYLPYSSVPLTTTNNQLELPDPRYLKLHAAVCRVSHLSGAYRQVQRKCEVEEDSSEYE